MIGGRQGAAFGAARPPEGKAAEQDRIEIARLQ
jgi:hypothetical protein